MSNDKIIDSLDLMAESLHLVQERFSRIRRPDDFVLTPEGLTLLDAIVMRLQVIGESVKQILKTNRSYLQRYGEVDWDKIGRFRDLVSHHYEHVDHESVCELKYCVSKAEFQNERWCLFTFLTASPFLTETS